MTHLTTDQLERFRARQMTPDELVIADSHLAECADCRARSGRPSSAVRLRQQIKSEAARAVEHLSAIQMEALAHDTATLAERRATESHLATCAACRGELTELQLYVAQLAEMRRGQATVEMRRVPRVVSAQAAGATPSLGARLRGWLTPPRRLAVAFAAMLLVVVSIPLLSRSRGGGSGTSGSFLDPNGAVQGRIELRDGELTIVQPPGGAVQGIDALAAPYRDAITRALDGVRQPPAKVPSVGVQGDSTSVSTARLAYPRVHLLLGALAMQVGLPDVAEREYRALLDANPGAPAAQRLLDDARRR